MQRIPDMVVFIWALCEVFLFGQSQRAREGPSRVWFSGHEAGRLPRARAFTYIPLGPDCSGQKLWDRQLEKKCNSVSP